MSAWAEIVNAQGDDEWLDKCGDALLEVQRETLRKAAEKQRAALLSDPGLSEAALIDLIDPEVE